MEKHRKNVLFYGAGVHAAVIYGRSVKKISTYGEPVAYIDGDIYKQGHNLFGLPVISWEDAKNRYGDNFYIYVTAEPRTMPEIIGVLLERGVQPERIINYAPVEKTLGCRVLNSSLCIEPKGSYVDYYGCYAMGDNLSYQDITLSHRINMDVAATSEGIRESLVQLQRMNQMISRGEIQAEYVNCRGCVDYGVRYQFKDKKIRIINLCGIGSCNYKCCYCCCNFIESERFNGRIYFMFRDILHTFQQEMLMDEDTVITVSAGEFLANKGGRELIAELAGKYPLKIFTNAYVYSFEAEKAIKTNGAILCDLDAGTPESYRKVKGVDGFERASEHIREYANHGPVILKYILLPEKNDSLSDLDGFCKMADETTARVMLARDFMDTDCRFSDKTLEFAARFIKHFRDLGKLNMDMTAFVRSGERDRLQKMLER